MTHRPGQAGALAGNLVAFGRVLRRAGLAVGPGETLAAAEGLALVGLSDRATVQAALRALLVRRSEDLPVFDRAFDAFWRDPAQARREAAQALLAPPDPAARPAPADRRVAEAMAGLDATAPSPDPVAPSPPPLLVEARAASGRERLRTLDFAAMSADELAAARRAIAALAMPDDRRRTRRFRPDRAGPAVDLRATVRASLALGGEVAALARRRRVMRPPPLVALCDISGSMARYAEAMLLFLHALAARRDRVSGFLFGTRLTDVTRALRHRDAEVARAEIARLVPDWSGGTRIGPAVDGFNRRWGRRVLGQGAVVLLITDGLDRGDAAGLTLLGEAMARLRRSCRRLVWLNPLLRYAAFQPKSRGIRAILPHVDEFRPVHDLASLASLVAALNAPARRDGMAAAALRWEGPAGIGIGSEAG